MTQSVRFRTPRRVRHVALACWTTIAVGAPWSGEPLAAAEVPRLSLVAARAFHGQITAETSRNAGFDKAPKLQFPGPVELVAVSLGERHAVAWLEQTPTAPRVRAQRTDPPGVRVIEMSFRSGERDAPSLTCLGGGAGEAAQIRRLPVSAGPGFLQYRYWDKSVGETGGLVHTFVYGKAAHGFGMVAKPLADAAAAVRHDELESPADGRLTLRKVVEQDGKSATTGCERRYALRVGESGNIEVSGVVEIAVGQDRVSYSAGLPLDGLSAEVESAIRGYLTPPGAGAGEKKAGDARAAVRPLTNGKLVAVWFPGAAPQALVIDLERLERRFLLRLLTDTQELLNAYDFTERKFYQASLLLGRLHLAERFATALGDELDEAELSKVKAGAANATAALEELVFRLPLEIAEARWTLLYSTRTNKGRLVPAELLWEPFLGRAFQFKIVNRPPTFVMVLKPTPAISLPAETIDGLKARLARENRHAKFLTAEIRTGLPPQVSASLPVARKDGVASNVKLLECRVARSDSVVLKLSAPEADAQELRELSLRTLGLPLRLTLDQFFLGKRDADQGASIECRVKAPDFKILTPQEQSFPITVLVDAGLFDRPPATEFKVRLRYPGETTEFTGVARKDAGEATVELPVRTKRGEIQFGVEFWSPGRNEWVTDAAGAEGLIVIDR